MHMFLKTFLSWCDIHRSRFPLLHLGSKIPLHRYGMDVNLKQICCWHNFVLCLHREDGKFSVRPSLSFSILTKHLHNTDNRKHLNKVFWNESTLSLSTASWMLSTTKKFSDQFIFKMFWRRWFFCPAWVGRMAVRVPCGHASDINQHLTQRSQGFSVYLEAGSCL